MSIPTGTTSAAARISRGLLRKIDRIPGKFRVRFMTSHPKDLTREVAEAMAESDKICRAAASSRAVGERSGAPRHDTGGIRAKSIFPRSRCCAELMPDIGLTTDIMVGFPTETEEDFQDTLSLVREVGYLNAFTFIYSPRKGTPAAAMPQLPYENQKAAYRGAHRPSELRHQRALRTLCRRVLRGARRGYRGRTERQKTA